MELSTREFAFRGHREHRRARESAEDRLALRRERQRAREHRASETAVPREVRLVRIR